MRIREKDAKKRQQAGGQEGTYRRKATPVKRYAGDLLAPVSVARTALECAVANHLCFSPTDSNPHGVFLLSSAELPAKSARQTDGHRRVP